MWQKVIPYTDTNISYETTASFFTVAATLLFLHSHAKTTSG